MRTTCAQVARRGLSRRGVLPRRGEASHGLRGLERAGGRAERFGRGLRTFDTNPLKADWRAVRALWKRPIRGTGFERLCGERCRDAARVSGPLPARRRLSLFILDVTDGAYTRDTHGMHTR